MCRPSLTHSWICTRTSAPCVCRLQERKMIRRLIVKQTRHARLIVAPSITYHRTRSTVLFRHKPNWFRLVIFRVTVKWPAVALNYFRRASRIPVQQTNTRPPLDPILRGPVAKTDERRRHFSSPIRRDARTSSANQGSSVVRFLFFRAVFATFATMERYLSPPIIPFYLIKYEKRTIRTAVTTIGRDFSGAGDRHTVEKNSIEYVVRAGGVQIGFTTKAARATRNVWPAADYYYRSRGRARIQGRVLHSLPNPLLIFTALWQRARRR